MTKEEQIRKLEELIIEAINLAISMLYRVPIPSMKAVSPSLDEIINLCSLFENIVHGKDGSEQFREAAEVIREAAMAAKGQQERNLTDCAYQLEDFLGRMRKINLTATRV